MSVSQRRSSGLLLSLPVLLLLLLVPATAAAQLSADTDEHTHVAEEEDPASILPEELSQLDPDELPPELTERIGRRVMGRLVGDERWHDWLNRLMGGEDSERLAELHRELGRAYLNREDDRAHMQEEFGHGMRSPGLLGGSDRDWFMPRIMLQRAVVLRLVLGLAAVGLVVGAVAAALRYRHRRRR